MWFFFFQPIPMRSNAAPPWARHGMELQQAGREV